MHATRSSPGRPVVAAAHLRRVAPASSRTSNCNAGARRGRPHVMKATAPREADRIRGRFWSVAVRPCRVGRVVAAEPMPSPSPGLAPLLCPACGGPVPVADDAAVPCPYCRTRVPVPATHRDALRLTRAEGAAVARADDAWRRFERSTVSNAMLLLFGSIPAVLFGVGLVAGNVAAWTDAIAMPAPELLGWAAWLPLAPAVGLTTWAYWRSLGQAHVAIARTGLAALRGDRPDGPLRCRICGAPLPAVDRDLFAHCIHCQADNLLSLDAVEQRAVAANVDRAEASAAAALAAVRARARRGSSSMRWMALIVAILCAPLALWSFVPSLWGSGSWAAGLSLDLALLSPIAFSMPLAVETKEHAGDAGNPAGLLMASGMFLGPGAFLILVAGVEGWWRSHPEWVILDVAIFLLPGAAFFATGVLRLLRRAFGRRRRATARPRGARSGTR